MLLYWIDGFGCVIEQLNYSASFRQPSEPLLVQWSPSCARQKIDQHYRCSPVSAAGNRDHPQLSAKNSTKISTYRLGVYYFLQPFKRTKFTKESLCLHILSYPDCPD